MVLIHEKITALLEQRRLKKRDLARALGVSPQTATDICKGRSAITLPHLRNLVSYFEIRAEFWLDDDRLAPIEIDQLARRGAAEALMRTGMLDIEDPQHLMDRVRGFIQQQRDAFLSSFPDLTAAERRLLGLADPEFGVVGKIGGSDMGAPQATPSVASTGTTPPDATRAQPAAAQSAAAQSAAAQSAAAQPATAQPATAQPATAQPATAQPATAQPASGTTDGSKATGAEMEGQ